jgi:hypothetical protein
MGQFTIALGQKAFVDPFTFDLIEFCNCPVRGCVKKLGRVINEGANADSTSLIAPASQKQRGL